jgi:hypothetical protein
MTPADDLGSDFSGVRAHAALELHMRECTERRAEDRADRAVTQARLNSMQESFDKRMAELNETFDKRMAAITGTFDKRTNAISNRMWAAAVGLIGILFVVAGFLLTKHIV